LLRVALSSTHVLPDAGVTVLITGVPEYKYELYSISSTRTVHGTSNTIIDSMITRNRKQETVDVGCHTSHINSTHVQ